jgi:hypothetical protein
MAMKNSVEWIVSDYLADNGYDGLRNSMRMCYCHARDIIPCAGAQPDCEPGLINSCWKCGTTLIAQSDEREPSCWVCNNAMTIRPDEGAF